MIRIFSFLLIICGLFTPLGCAKNENSTTQDPFLLTPKGKQVLSQTCSQCHNYHQLSEAELVQQGLVIRGDSFRSPLYYRINGSLGAYGPKNMPPTGAVSDSDITDFAAWIDNLQ